MSKIYVFHASDRLFESDRLDVMMGFRPNHDSKCANLMAQGAYDMVATLTDCDDLERAFMLTNSIDDPWYDHDLCVANNIVTDGEYRSTSVGDIMLILDGNMATFHVVSSFGFRNVTEQFWEFLEIEGFEFPQIVTCPRAQEELKDVKKFEG